MKKFFVILFLTFCIAIFFYTNTFEYKMQNFQGKNINDIKNLKLIYNNATKYCTSQNFESRGPYTACVEEKMKNFSKESYDFFIETQNFCENLTNNLADKWLCVDEIMD